MKQWKKMLLILMCAGAMSGLTGCGNNTNNTDDNAVNEVEDGVEDGVDDICLLYTSPSPRDCS